MTITWFEFLKKVIFFYVRGSKLHQEKIAWMRQQLPLKSCVCNKRLSICLNFLWHARKAWQKILMKVIGDAETNINHLTLTVNIIFWYSSNIFQQHLRFRQKKTIIYHLMIFHRWKISDFVFVCQSQTKERFCQTKQSFSVI